MLYMYVCVCMYLYKLFNLTRKFCKNERKRAMLTGLSIDTVFPVSDLKSCIKIIHDWAHTFHFQAPI